MYQIPKQIKSEIKITSMLYLRDVAIFLFIMAVAYTFDSLVHLLLKVPYYIFVAGITIYFVLPSKANPGKRNYHTLYFAILRNRTKYYRMSLEQDEGVEAAK